MLNDPHHLNDPDQLTPQQRRDEVAALLADGVLYARRHGLLDPAARSTVNWNCGVSLLPDGELWYL